MLLGKPYYSHLNLFLVLVILVDLVALPSITTAFSDVLFVWMSRIMQAQHIFGVIGHDLGIILLEPTAGKGLQASLALAPPSTILKDNSGVQESLMYLGRADHARSDE